MMSEDTWNGQIDPTRPRSLTRGPERFAGRAYAFRQRLDSGATVVNGSYAPAAGIDRIAALYASVTLRMADGSAFNPGRQMAREEALSSCTQGAAYAAFEKKLDGSITPGKLADLLVLSPDIMRVTEEENLGTQVLYTILGGEVVFEADRLECSRSSPGSTPCPSTGPVSNE